MRKTGKEEIKKMDKSSLQADMCFRLFIVFHFFYEKFNIVHFFAYEYLIVQAKFEKNYPSLNYLRIVAKNQLFIYV